MGTHYSLDIVRNYSVSEPFDFGFLDSSLDLFLAGSVREGMDQLRDGLRDLYALTTVEEWQDLLKNVVLSHPIKKTILEDPLTARSFNRPRGYAGDAEVLDMIYFPDKVDLGQVSNIGKKLFGYTTQTQIARALRERKDLLASYIEKTVEENNGSEILSVACGHCREIELVEPAKRELIGRFAGIDQDYLSLEQAKSMVNLPVTEFLDMSIIDLIRKDNLEGKYNLIYSAGLYDYIGSKLAKRLTKNLYNRLAPGGRLLLFNVISDYREIGYFESYLNWPLIGRDQTAMFSLVDDIPSNEIATCEVKAGKNQTFHYLVVQRL